MALTYTPPGIVGSQCPDFRLPSVDGGFYQLSDWKGKAKALVVMFICNHCPYVQAIEDRMIALAKEFSPRGVQFVGICANDPEDYPEDSPEELAKRWNEKSYGFPYLYDESQSVARSFGAVCTPDFFVYNSDLRLTYRGRLDDSWKNAQLVRKREMASALESTLAGKDVQGTAHPSMGCSIKWKTT